MYWIPLVAYIQISSSCVYKPNLVPQRKPISAAITTPLASTVGYIHVLYIYSGIIHIDL